MDFPQTDPNDAVADIDQNIATVDIAQKVVFTTQPSQIRLCSEPVLWLKFFYKNEVLSVINTTYSNRMAESIVHLPEKKTRKISKYQQKSVRVTFRFYQRIAHKEKLGKGCVSTHHNLLRSHYFIC